MKRFVAMILMMILCLSCLPLASAADIVSNKGLTVLSPEQYLGIEPCDTISTQDNWYKYQYTNRGLPWYSYGTSNPVDWRRMEKYVNALVDSGYYVVLEHEHPNPEEEYWCLGYVGPGSVTKTFGANGNTTQKAAIVVKSDLGDIGVYFSLDITVDDIDETQKRLGKSIFDEPVNSGGGSSGGKSTCLSCGGNGRHSACGGMGYYRRANGTIDDCSCFAGYCPTCGGDGKR